MNEPTASPESGERLVVRIEWGYAAPAMAGFAAKAPAAPGGPMDGGDGACWYTALDAREATIEQVRELDLGEGAETAGNRAWRTRPANGRTAAVEVTCLVQPDAKEPLLAIRTNPDRAGGFCINLRQLREEKTIYAPAIGYFFSIDPAPS